MLTKRLMIDSGAYSVWTQGISIDLEQYIQFCEQHPLCSYYVNLDVIPGKPNDRSSVTPEAISFACKSGWENYERMKERLPEKKLIHVYHQCDPLHWLEKLLEENAPYIGLAPRNEPLSNRTSKKPTLRKIADATLSKVQWLRSIRKLICDGAGRPLAKFHGFACTQFDVIHELEWHSVDSSTWAIVAGMGIIFVPKRNRDGSFNCSIKPDRIDVSCVRSDILSRKPIRLEQIRFRDWLEEIDIPIGKHILKKVTSGYKPGEDEVWFDRKENVVAVVSEMGVSNSHEKRRLANSRFFKQANKVVPVDHLYFAGGLGESIDFGLGRILTSYHELTPKKIEALGHHEEMIRKRKEDKK